MVRAWEHLAKGRASTVAPPAIVPLVLYHGEAPWRGARRFADLMDAGGALLGVRPLAFDLVLVDLGAVDAPRLDTVFSTH